MLQSGKRSTYVGRCFGVNESTVRFIANCETQLREAMRKASPVIKTIRKSRDPCIEKMENALVTWIDEMKLKNIPLSFSLISMLWCFIIIFLKTKRKVGKKKILN